MNAYHAQQLHLQNMGSQLPASVIVSSPAQSKLKCISVTNMICCVMAFIPNVFVWGAGWLPITLGLIASSMIVHHLRKNLRSDCCCQTRDAFSHVHGLLISQIVFSTLTMCMFIGLTCMFGFFYGVCDDMWNNRDADVAHGTGKDNRLLGLIDNEDKFPDTDDYSYMCASNPDYCIDQGDDDFYGCDEILTHFFYQKFIACLFCAAFNLLLVVVSSVNLCKLTPVVNEVSVGDSYCSGGNYQSMHVAPQQGHAILSAPPPVNPCALQQALVVSGTPVVQHPRAHEVTMVPVDAPSHENTVAQPVCRSNEGQVELSLLV